MNNSSQPYLYKIENNKYLLYCFADSVRTLIYGNEYSLRPWKIKHKNLDNGEDIVLSTPTHIDGYGETILECNPHLIIYNNNRYLYYTAGFCLGDNYPINYYLCRLLANNLDNDYLENQSLEILKNTFTGTYFNQHILYQKRNTNKTYLYLDNSDTAISLAVDFLDILKINPIFNSNKLIVTGQTMDGSMRSFLLSNNYAIEREILNNTGMSIYKCSIMDDTLIYTVRHNDVSDIESRSLVTETMNSPIII
jgi:hypothetical protein